MVLGDARQTLSRLGDAAYDLLVLDAFSSDAIPAHLLTREALQVYLAKLSPDGLIAFHISNRHLDLRPVLAALARDRGLSSLVQLHVVPTVDRFASSSEWFVMARSTVALGGLANDARWERPERKATRIWTDDYSDLLTTMRFE